MKIYFLLIIILFIISCDCAQKAEGIVLDKETTKPLGNVGIGKFEKEDPNNSFSRRTYSDSTGMYDYHSLGGGLFRCEGLTLYYSKGGYETTKVNLSCCSQNDTVYLQKIK